MSEHHLDIVRQVLDRQVVDANHIYCGKVDNIVIDLKGRPKITAILVGNGPASDRLPVFFTLGGDPERSAASQCGQALCQLVPIEGAAEPDRLGAAVCAAPNLNPAIYDLKSQRQNRNFIANWTCRADPESPVGKRVLLITPNDVLPTEAVRPG